MSVSVSVDAAGAVVDALTNTWGLPRDGILPALSALGLACWSAHQADERGDDHENDDEDDMNDADVEADDVDSE